MGPNILRMDGEIREKNGNNCELKKKPNLYAPTILILSQTFIL